MFDRAIGEKVEALLGLERRVIGVRFVFDEHTFQLEDAVQVKHKMAYCNMVRLAANGMRLKANLDNFLCIGSAKALGLIEPDERAVSGRIYYGFGIYNSLGTARNVQKDVTFLDHKAYGVVVKPVGAFESKPDVVLMLVNPYQGMRVLQSYVYHKGMPKNLRLAANSGICSECTAAPYATNDMNLSLLCSNTRYAAKWEDDEMGIGMPYALLQSVLDGMLRTVNPCEPNEKKKAILDRARGAEFAGGILMDSTYYRTSGKP